MGSVMVRVGGVWDGIIGNSLVVLGEMFGGFACLANLPWLWAGGWGILSWSLPSLWLDSIG